MPNLFMVGADGTFDVASSLATGKTVITWVLGLISEQPVLAACFVLGTIIPAGIVAFRRFKSAAN